MAFFHCYAEHCAVNAVKRQNIRRIQIHFFNAVSLGKILGIPGQLEHLFPDGHLISHGIHLVVLYIVILPCCLRQLHGGQMLLTFQKSHIHDVPLLQLTQGNCLSIFICEPRCSVHGQRVTFAQIQI